MRYKLFGLVAARNWDPMIIFSWCYLIAKVYVNIPENSWLIKNFNIWNNCNNSWNIARYDSNNGKFKKRLQNCIKNESHHLNDVKFKNGLKTYLFFI